MEGEGKGAILVLIAFSIILMGLEIYSLTTDSHYKYDFIFLMGLLWGVYFYRKNLNLHPAHYLLLASFLVLHNLGVFNLYETYPLGVEYDHWVHGYFGFVAALMLYRFYDYLNLYHRIFKVVAIVVVLLGLSALHELYEYGGAIFLGEGEGVLFIGAGDLDEWDTQNDMLNNVIGGAIGLLLYGIWNSRGEIFLRGRGLPHPRGGNPSKQKGLISPIKRREKTG